MLIRNTAELSQKLVQQAVWGYVHIQTAKLQVTASDAPLNVTALACIPGISWQGD